MLNRPEMEKLPASPHVLGKCGALGESAAPVDASRDSRGHKKRYPQILQALNARAKVPFTDKRAARFERVTLCSFCLCVFLKQLFEPLYQRVKLLGVQFVNLLFDPLYSRRAHFEPSFGNDSMIRSSNIFSLYVIFDKAARKTACIFFRSSSMLRFLPSCAHAPGACLPRYRRRKPCRGQTGSRFLLRGNRGRSCIPAPGRCRRPP